MASKGMEALKAMYTNADSEEEDAEEAASYSPVSTEEGKRSQEASVRAGKEVDLTPIIHAASEEPLETPPILHGFPQNIDLRVEERVKLPDDTTRPASAYLEDKIAELLAKQKRQNTDVNQEIQKNKAFRNPSIYSKLIEFCGIDEFGSNFDPADFNPSRWKESNINVEELRKRQLEVTERNEREKKAKGGTDVPKRKTKWDSSGTTGKPGLPVRAVGQNVSKVPSSSNLTKSTK